jgi:beta-glucosidase
MESFFEARLPPPGSLRKTLLGPLVNPMPEEAATPVGPPTIITLPMGHPAGVMTALQDGSVSAASVTRAARRVLVQMQRFGRLGGESDAPLPNGEQAEREMLANAAVVLNTSEDAAVLLKNDTRALPLTAADLSSLALIGPGAMQNIAVGESGEKALGFLPRQVSPWGALVAAGARIDAAVADDMDGSVMPVQLQRLDAQGHVIAQDAQLDFTRARGNALPAGIELSWTGSLQIPRAGRYRLYLQVLGASAVWEVDGQRLGGSGPLQTHGNILQPGQDNVLATRDGLDNVRRELQLSAGAHAVCVKLKGEKVGQPVQVRLAWVSPEQRNADYQRAIDSARHAVKAVVFAWSRNRPSFALPGDQDQLIADVAAVNPNTIVVLNVSEPIAMPWLDHVKAVLLMWYPGDEGGRATANVLMGRVSPAGRLPFTWPEALQQNDPAHPERSSAGVEGKTLYSEGLFVGYRWFDQQQLAPLFPFGYGLSYTRFDYSDLKVRAAAQGGLEVGMLLRNSGTVAGDEVVQLYLGAPERPPPGVQFASRALAAFERVHLGAGQSRRVLLHVVPRSLQFWSVAQRSWVSAPGPRAVYVGRSERDLPLVGATCDHPGHGCVLNTGSVADR